MPEWAEGVFQFRCKDITLFCYNKIKMNYFLCFCKILLESWFLMAGGCDFFMARKILRPRHAVCFMGRWAMSRGL